MSVTGRRVGLGPGDFGGEMTLLSGAPRAADVTALDSCQPLTLSQADVARFVGGRPGLRARLDQGARARDEMNRQTPDAVSAAAPAVVGR